MDQLFRRILKSLLMLSVLMMAACASIQQTERVEKIDPFERVNRVVFSFNETADQYVIKPIA
jgi:phospholipid-binding lipoprotein MlaA